MAKFGDLVEIVKVSVKPSGFHQDEKYLGYEHVEPHALRASGFGNTSGISSPKTRFGKDQVIYGRLRPYFRKVIFTGESEGLCSSDFWVFKPKEGVVPRFAFYIAALEEFSEEATASSTGTRMPRASWDVVKNFEVPDFSYEEQRTISAVLGGLDDKIESNQRQILALHEMAVAKFLSLDFDEFRQLSDVATITMGSSPKGATLNEDGLGEVFYQGTRDFGFRYPVNRVWTTLPTRMAQVGDTLVAVRAPVGTLNRAPERLCIGRGLAAVSSNWRSLVFYSLLDAEEEFEPYNSEGTVFGAINKQALNALRIRWPKEPDHADQELATLDDAIWCYSKQNDLLKSLRDTLLPELLSGRITPGQLEVGL